MNLIKYDSARFALQQAAEVGTKIPNIPGVYAFYEGNKCMYVGESINLRKRISTHERKTQLKGCDIRFFVCDDRRRIEKRLIADLSPVKNGMSPQQEFIKTQAEAKFRNISDEKRFCDVFESLFGESSLFGVTK